MIRPVELQSTFPMTLHGGAVSTTTQVWEMLAASRAGDVDRALALMAERPELATCQFNYTPPLHFVVREGHARLARELVARYAYDPSYKSYPFGDSLLVMAEDRGNAEIADLLRDAGNHPGQTRTWRETGAIDFGQDDEEKAFEQAVHAGHDGDVERALERRPQLALNPLSSWAEGVLMMPAKKRDRRLLDLLVRYGAQVPAMSKWGRFYYFVHDDVAAFLLDSGMNPQHATWHEVTLLHDMAQQGDIAKARLLLDRGADIDAVDDEYRTTPLGMAARWGERRMAAWLIERGADPNKAGAAWSTPLAWATKRGHRQLADDLRAAGAKDE